MDETNGQNGDPILTLRDELDKFGKSVDAVYGKYVKPNSDYNFTRIASIASKGEKRYVMVKKLHFHVDKDGNVNNFKDGPVESPYCEFSVTDGKDGKYIVSCETIKNNSQVCRVNADGTPDEKGSYYGMILTFSDTSTNKLLWPCGAKGDPAKPTKETGGVSIRKYANGKIMAKGAMTGISQSVTGFSASVTGVTCGVTGYSASVTLSSWAFRVFGLGGHGIKVATVLFKKQFACLRNAICGLFGSLVSLGTWCLPCETTASAFKAEA